MDYIYDENCERPDFGGDELSAEWAEYRRWAEYVCRTGESEGEET